VIGAPQLSAALRLHQQGWLSVVLTIPQTPDRLPF
jgi:hypothetical protein